MKKTDIKKTLNYMKRNGVRSTVGAAYERLTACYDAGYQYELPSASILQMQRETASWESPVISILVPAFETPETYMEQLLQSVMEQSYTKWELVLADASNSDCVKKVVEKFASQHPELKLYDGDQTVDDYSNCIRYIRLEQNGGISANTNAALRYATGDYTGLLDHDDILTPDALYEMASKIQEMNKQGHEAVFVYSDEDKCNEECTNYFEPNIKQELNLDLILSNNYICHFLVMKTTWMRKIAFRDQYDGAQDYDLILQTIAELIRKRSDMNGIHQYLRQNIGYVSKVLYHWRSYGGSTAGNPASKNYAYEAGKRALESFFDTVGWMAVVRRTAHVGFYRAEFQPDVFSIRKDIAGIGGSVYNRDRIITTGLMDKNGNCPYKTLPLYYAGPCNRADTIQDAYAIDARTLFLREEWIPLYEETIGVTYVRREYRNRKFSNQLDNQIWKQRSMQLADALREKGYSLLWNPVIHIPE